MSRLNFRLAGLAVVIALIWTAALGVIWHTRKMTIREQTSAAEQAATLVAAYVTKTMMTGELMLGTMLDWVANEDVQTVAEFERTFSQQNYFELLRERIRNLGQIDVATFIAPDGRILIFTRTFPPPKINLADRDYFIEQLGPGPLETSLGNVVPNRGTGWYTMYLAKRVTSKAGMPLGVVIIGLRSDYFADFFRQTIPDGVVSLWRSDGTLLVTSARDTDIIGRRYPDAASLRLIADHPAGHAALVDSPAPFDQGSAPDRVLAVHPVAGFPAHVAVRFDADAVFADWRDERDYFIGLAVVLSIATIAVGWRLHRLQISAEKASRLEGERTLLSSLVDSSGALLMLTDRDLRVLMVNREFERFWNVAGADMTGRCLASTQTGTGLPSSVRERWITGEAREPVRFERRIVDALGRPRMLNVTASPIIDSRGGLRQIAFLGVDDTDRTEAEHALFQNERMAMVGEMAATIAHDVAQPLGVIEFACSNALEEITQATGSAAPLDNEYIAARLKRIDQQVRRASSILGDVRNFLRSERAEDTGPFDPLVAVSNAVDMTGHDLAKRSIALIMTMPDQLPSICGHSGRLEQVLINLINNARDAGSTRIEVRGLVKAAEAVCLAIIDNGPGIPDHILPRLFKAFVTTKPKGKGTGLGLRICARIVEEMGGTIVASNRPQGGASFELAFPAYGALTLSTNRDVHSESDARG